MIKEFTIETERQEVESMLGYLKDFLNEKDSWEIPHKYTIAENFPIGEGDDYTPNVYELINLKIDTIEDGIVIFDDGEGILEEKMRDGTPCVLQAFVKDSVIYIGFQSDKKITISMNKGYVQIYY